MEYKPYLNVAQGIRGQLEACSTALEEHDQLPDELNSVADMIETIISECDVVISRAESEPDK